MLEITFKIDKGAYGFARLNTKIQCFLSLIALRTRGNINRELKQATFLSTWTSDCRGGTGLKTVFVSVCGNLQHM